MDYQTISNYMYRTATQAARPRRLSSEEGPSVFNAISNKRSRAAQCLTIELRAADDDESMGTVLIGAAPAPAPSCSAPAAELELELDGGAFSLSPKAAAAAAAPASSELRCIIGSGGLLAPSLLLVYLIRFFS